MTPLREIPLKPGAAGFNQAWSATAFLLAVVLLAAGAVGLKRNQERYAELAAWRVHTLLVLGALDGVLIDAAGMESAGRGYALTHLPDRRVRFVKERAAMMASLDEVAGLVTDNPEQEATLLQLRSLLDQRADRLQGLVEARDRQGLAAAAAYSGLDIGGQLMSGARDLHATMVGREEALLVARKALADDSWRKTRLATVVYAACSVLLGLGGLLLVLRDRRARQRLEAEQARVNLILEETPDFIGMATAEGRIVYHNRAFRELRGLKAGEPLGALDPATLARFYAPDSLASLQGALAQAKSGSIWAGEQELLDAAGRPVPVSQVILPHKDRAGRVTHISTVARDIRSQKEMDRLKDEFVATVSHELRTPLTSIKGALGLLTGGAAGTLPDAVKSLVGIAASNTERLIRLINDILDIGKAEAGKLEFSMRPLKLDEVAVQALESTAPYFAQLGAAVQWDPGIPGARVMADEGRLVQVLVNLLSNAAKFSPEGEPVRIRTLRADGRLRLEVVNGGPGIPEAFRERIFQKFAQADASDRRAKSGSGLGLNIAKALAERMGGSLGFESAEGRTCFWVTLPELVASPRPAAAPDQYGKPRILLCEDDPDVASVVCMALEWDGYAVEVASTAALAREALAGRGFDALVLDLHLPDGDGLDLLRHLRSQETMRHLPVVVASARADEARQEIRGQAMEVLGWLSKPLDTRDLVRLLEPVMRSQGPGARILHVEDDPDVATLTAQALAPLGAVITAPDLAAARRILRQGGCALAILDVRLPDGSGLDLIPDLLALEPRPRIVLFSAEEQSAEIVRRLDAALVKTQVGSDDLVALIRRLLADRKA